MLGKLERGERKLTSSWIEKISLALSVKPAELLGDDDAIIPQGDVTADGLIVWRDDADSIAEISGMYPDEAGDPDWVKPNFKARSVMVAEKPVNLTLPVGAELVYDLEAGLLPVRTGELCIAGVGDLDTGGTTPVLAVLVPGSTSETYHILPLGGAMQMDQKVGFTMRISQIIL